MDKQITFEEVQRAIETIRASYKLNLDDLATLTGVSRATIGRVEQGVGNPTDDTLNKIFNGLNNYVIDRMLLNLYSQTIESGEEFADLLKFHRIFLDELGYELLLNVLNLNDTPMQITTENKKVSFLALPKDLKDIKEKVFNYYKKVFFEKYPFDKLDNDTQN